MNYDQYAKEMNMLITAYHERAEKPRLQKHNQAHKTRNKKRVKTSKIISSHLKSGVLMPRN